MGNRIYDSFELEKGKRDWIAFYSGLQQISEVLIFYNIIRLFLFDKIIVLPIVMVLLQTLKKWLMIAFDHRYQEYASEQNYLCHLLGFTPSTITDQYVKTRGLEFIIHFLLIYSQVLYIVIYQDDRISLLIGTCLGMLSVLGFLNQDKYFRYNEDWLILLQSLEYTIGCLLVIFSTLLYCSFGVFPSLFLIFLFVVEIVLIQNKLSFEQINEVVILSQIIGFMDTSLRDSKLSRIYKGQLSTKKCALNSISLFQIVILSIVNGIFIDEMIFVNVRTLMYVLLVCYIPCSISTLKAAYQYCYYGDSFTQIVIMQSDILNLTPHQIAHKYTHFYTSHIHIHYEIFDVKFKIIQTILTHILLDKQRIFTFDIHYQGNRNTIQMLVDKEQLEIRISYFSNKVVEMVLSALTDSQFNEPKVSIFFIDLQKNVHSQHIQLVLMKFYKLINLKMSYIENQSWQSPHCVDNTYIRSIAQLIAFNKHISTHLLINPLQVTYDLYHYLF